MQHTASCVGHLVELVNAAYTTVAQYKSTAACQSDGISDSMKLRRTSQGPIAWCPGHESRMPLDRQQTNPYPRYTHHEGRFYAHTDRLT